MHNFLLIKFFNVFFLDSAIFNQLKLFRTTIYSIGGYESKTKTSTRMITCSSSF